MCFLSTQTQKLYVQSVKTCLLMTIILILQSQKCLSKAFIPVIRSMWPGINDHSGGSSYMVSNMRKRAVQASRFMLQMMQTPLYVKETEVEDDNGCKTSQQVIDGSEQPSVECGEEGLAIRIATEVIVRNCKFILWFMIALKMLKDEYSNYYVFA